MTDHPSIAATLRRLTDKDLAILDDIGRFRLLTSTHIEQLHFAADRTPVASVRACNRALSRLRGLGLVTTLARRIGGVRRGSSGLVWYLAPRGDRLGQLRRGEAAHRRRFSEPSQMFVDHTLAIADLAVEAMTAARAGQFEIVRIDTEPTNWLPSLTGTGVATVLKPDLDLVTADGDYEQHWFIEADRATEHLPVIRRQCEAYRHHRATGRYQAAHGVYPAVLWVCPDAARADAIRRVTPADPMFRVCERSQFLTALTTPDDETGPR